MNRIILLLVLGVMFSCNDKKNKETEVAPKVVEKQYTIVKNFSNEDLANWRKVRVNLESSTDVEFSDKAYLLSRNSITESSYLSSGLIPVVYAAQYRVSIVVKKGTNNNFFGLRIMGAYPDRADAVFDLEKGTVLEYKASQDFDNPMATIEKLSDGWYNCTLSSEVAADNVKILMGATGAEKKVTSWEGKTKTQGNVYFVPSRLKFEEVLN